MRPTFLLLTALLALPAAADPPAYIKTAIEAPDRHDDAADDRRRHPAELLEFAQVKPGDIVIDLVPGAGYFTRLFSRIVGPTGHVYALWPDEYARIDGGEVLLLESLAHDPHYPNITVLHQPAAQLAFPVKADLVWTSQNIHDYPDRFMGRVDLKALSQSILQGLKPGGRFVVIDHVAQPGSGLLDAERFHRIDPQFVKDQALAAGFSWDGESDVLRNPADGHSTVVFDPSIRGHTDQFAYRFRAPN